MSECPSPDCPAAPDCGCSGVADLWTLDPRDDDEPGERRPHCITTILDGRDHCAHDYEGPFL